ncbi:hydrolase [Bacillaceae bacterium W0354]
MDKRKFYVCVETQEISELKAGNNDQFVIYGGPEDIIKLRECFDEMQDAEYSTFWRAHVPFKEYHHDEDNDSYDECLLRAYKMIYNLGDQETRNHIEQMPFFSELDKIDY